MIENEYCCGLTHDRDVLKEAIVDMLDKLATERLRMLYLTILAWARGA